ncbi:stomatin-like protein 2, mitochondrial [Rosa sericea]
MSMFRRNCLNALRPVRRLSHPRFRNYASCGCVGDTPAKFWCSVVAPKDHAYVIERFDRYWETLMPGESVILFPLTDTIAHVQCFNEKQLMVPDHTVFTNDLCPITVSGLISLKIEDARRASYLPEHPMATAIRRAKTAMRSAVARVAYDNLYLETRYINNFIVTSPPPIHWSGGFLVPNTQAVVIERFGKYPKVMWPGIRRLIPFVDKIVNVVSLREKTIHIPAQNATTRNSIPLSVSAEFTMRISDPVLASYEVDNPVVETIALVQRTLRSVIGQFTFEHIVQCHGYLHNRLIFALVHEVARWGVACRRFEINDIAVSPEFKKVLEDRKAEKQNKGLAEVLSISSNALKRACAG